jgi:ABC-type glutathione transport system ATPase component
VGSLKEDAGLKASTTRYEVALRDTSADDIRSADLQVGQENHMTDLVRVKDVHKHFTRGSERIDVLKGVNLEIPKGSFLALMGPSGSGKTTLLNLIGGLDTPTGGAIDVDGVPVSSLSGSQRIGPSFRPAQPATNKQTENAPATWMLDTPRSLAIGADSTE